MRTYMPPRPGLADMLIDAEFVADWGRRIAGRWSNEERASIYREDAADRAYYFDHRAVRDIGGLPESVVPEGFDAQAKWFHSPALSLPAEDFEWASEQEGLVYDVPDLDQGVVFLDVLDDPSVEPRAVPLVDPRVESMPFTLN